MVDQHSMVMHKEHNNSVDGEAIRLLYKYDHGLLVILITQHMDNRIYYRNNDVDANERSDIHVK
ncbi:MAG: hypothetical protein CM15mV1_1480 [uncultured marine virus]|nr:MAG: hypothetical protein CM15mV1_1480 [uncultured marine virus]